MLTPKQKTLFQLLGMSEDKEQALRQNHRLMLACGANKNFTAWLEKGLRANWRYENKTAYVGD
jgi:hypothetical protein